jgi:hypothetical protein
VRRIPLAMSSVKQRWVRAGSAARCDQRAHVSVNVNGPSVDVEDGEMGDTGEERVR